MALCTRVSRASAFEAEAAISSSDLQNGMQTASRQVDIASVLQTKLQEQSKDILRCFDARLEKQLKELSMQWCTQKADISLMLDSKLQEWYNSDANGMHLPVPPDIQLNGKEGVDETSDHNIATATRERALLHQQYMDICGWKSDPTGPIVRTMQSRRQGDLVGFEPGSRIQASFSKAVHSTAFQSASAILVLANTVMISIQLDLDLQRATAGQDELSWETYSDLAFTIVFLVELLLRFCAERRHFFTGPGRHWNIFEVAVVATGIIDLLQVINFSLTFLRILRILRIIRVLRVLRIFKFCRELRLMALSIVSCLRSLIWAFMLLLMSFFMFSLVLLESARNYLRGDVVDETVRADLNEYYSGVWMSIYTLIQAVSGGKNWGEVADCFLSISWFYGVAFTAFIIFVMFGLLNVLVGVFVQNTEAIAHIDRDFVIQEELERKTSLVNQMRQLFKEVDADDSGTITWNELKANLGDESMKAYFSTLQIETDEAQGLFKLLDTDESGEVAIEEFIMGCMRLKGTAKSIDLASMLYENKKLHAMLHRYMDSMTGKLAQIEAVISSPTFPRVKSVATSLPAYENFKV